MFFAVINKVEIFPLFESVGFQTSTGAPERQPSRERPISDDLGKKTIGKQRIFPTLTSAEGICLTQFASQLCNVPCRGRLAERRRSSRFFTSPEVTATDTNPYVPTLPGAQILLHLHLVCK